MYDAHAGEEGMFTPDGMNLTGTIIELWNE